MNQFIIVFIVCIALLLLLLFISVKFWSRRGHDDEEFRDEKGRHVYYDRSIIEKDEFNRNNPQIPYSEIRSLRRLLRWRRSKHN